MTRCNEISSAEDSACGKVICCFDCPDKDICKDVCSTAKAEDAALKCESRMTEETGLVAMQKATSAIIAKVAELEVQKKKLEEAEKAFREQLIQAMERYGVKSFDAGSVSFTYVAPTTRNTIDSKALKAAMPDVAKQFTKTSPVKASVKITVKG